MEGRTVSHSVREQREGGGEKESERLMVGDWVAQWDKAYNTWFYYNTKTGAVSLSIFLF